MKRAFMTTAALLIVAVVATPARAAPSQRYEPETTSSHLAVEGTSTMHDWEAAGNVIGGYLILSESDLTSLWRKSASLPQKINPTVHVEIPIGSLKSGKSGLDKKMYETLKAQTHPVITYQMKTAELKPDPNTSKTDTEGKITIETKGILTVAGEEGTVAIPMQIRRLPNSHLEVRGETTLYMTDFGLTPPKLMGGLLRTGNEVHVKWECVWGPAATDPE